MPNDLLDLAELLESWCRQMRAERKSAQTQRAYRLAVEAFLAYCADAGVPAELSRTLWPAGWPLSTAAPPRRCGCG